MHVSFLLPFPLLPPFFPPFSISFPVSSDDPPRSWAKCFRITQGLFRICGIWGFCRCGHCVWKPEVQVGTWQVQKAGQSLQGTAAAEKRNGGREGGWEVVAGGWPRDADIGGFEKMRKSCQADKWQVRGLLVVRLTHRKKPRHETMGYAQRLTCSSSLTEHEI